MTIPALSLLQFRRSRVDTVQYARGRQLDIHLDPQAGTGDRPVLVYVPGGAWVATERKIQGAQLMSHLVDQGWICVSIDYRTAPLHRWPAPFDDVVAAWMWVTWNINEYGGGDFIAIAGASAGAHMASLLALRNGRTPDALVSLYGVYSWVDKSWDHWLINQFVKTVVADKKDLRAASPILHAHRDAPPTLIVHGDKDFVTPFSGAKKFWAALDDVAINPPWLFRVRGGHHAFDLIDSNQADAAIEVIDEFLTNAYSETRAAS